MWRRGLMTPMSLGQSQRFLIKEDAYQPTVEQIVAPEVERRLTGLRRENLYWYALLCDAQKFLLCARRKTE